MIKFEKKILNNGLRVIVHEDMSTPMIAINVLYNVGARDEHPDKTGFAHLFEHLMFGGSKNVKSFDKYIQNAGGENNAFTNNDITNFYDVVPANNIEIPLWLESDRMLGLDINKKSLDVQRKVVIEEFKETCLDEPYGDIWHHLGSLAYQKHPYQWPTIGKDMSHIAQANLSDVKSFFHNYYCPNNAILVLSGNLSVKKGFELAEKWFGSISKGKVPKRNLPQENEQNEKRSKSITCNVPVDALYIAFPTPARLHFDYYVCDLLSDALSNGRSSRFFQRLFKKQRIFSSIDAYVTGSIDPGLFIIEGKPAHGVTLEDAEKAIWHELELLKTEGLDALELQKIKNKVESNITYSEGSNLSKAINLAFYELLDNANLINTEIDFYAKVDLVDMKRVANEIFRADKSNTVYYKALNPSGGEYTMPDDEEDEDEDGF